MGGVWQGGRVGGAKIWDGGSRSRVCVKDLREQRGQGVWGGVRVHLFVWVWMQDVGVCMCWGGEMSLHS